MSDDLNELIARSVAAVKAMSSEEREAMFKAQRESYARSCAAEPRARYQWVNKVKVYDSYSDYCLD